MEIALMLQMNVKGNIDKDYSLTNSTFPPAWPPRAVARRGRAEPTRTPISGREFQFDPHHMPSRASG
ncbi:hypothetical protein EVAR_22386_1 [Eumeta japonica]|uniref:Uncharacterized protein n=1 Tax=Eumeta variegata TaxID=151549 RepID=A0A4C1VKB4_EUMVA|nr:hypothetical protein EVAR_22386_1 [Eumeta japonica]